MFVRWTRISSFMFIMLSEFRVIDDDERMASDKFAGDKNVRQQRV